MTATTVHFTIASANYLPYVRTLHNSLIEADPDAVFFLFLVDELDDQDLIEALPFDVVEARTVGIPCFFDMAYRYTIMELNTAIKPFCIQYLMDECGFQRIIYLDPDILVLKPLTAVHDAFDQHAELILTPHTRRPLDDGHHPDDRALMLTGAYNLGFCAFANAPETRQLLAWWAEHLRTRCLVDLANGMFVDQKFMDYAPAFVGATMLLHDPGYNAAYWNLHERSITKDSSGTWLADGGPLTFFHFSGVDPTDPSVFSRHQNRFTTSELGDLGTLLEEYLAKLKANTSLGTAILSSLRYAYGRHTNGTPILDVMRQVYRRVHPVPQEDDFNSLFAFEPSFYNEKAERLVEQEGLITRLMHEIWSSRQDLKDHFDLNRTADRSAFIEWFASQAPQEHQLPEPLFDFLPRPEQESGQTSYAAGPVDHTRDESVLLCGYLKTESGVGQGARSLRHALETAGIATHTLTLMPAEFDNTVQAERRDPTKSRDRVAIINANADRTLDVVTRHRKKLEGQYRIGYWAWELPKFPDAWLPAIECVHEIWCPSAFVTNAVSAMTSKPVRTIPHAVEPGNGDGSHARRRLDIGDDTRVVLTTFDTRSFLARKNPAGALEAFKRAFPAPKTDDVVFVMKSHGPADSAEAKRLFTDMAQSDNIISLHGVIEPDALNDLYAAADVFLSLHRSEGFGLSLARSMVEGKPVIATGWSGNIDYMTTDNSRLVEYELADVPPSAYPFAEGQIWAEPSIDHAAMLLRQLIDDPEARKLLGQEAAASAKSPLCRDRIGWLARQRLGEIFTATRRG
ncbi:MAG: glycosyltransferase [Pseudomonadota bacterium]